MARMWIPNQHGAWAMLIAPVLVGAFAGGLTAWHILLLLSWLAAFCLNFFTALTVKTRRTRRYRRQLVSYATALLVFGLPLLVHAPELLLLSAVALPAFAINLAFVLHRNERAWVNDVVGVVLAGGVGYGAYLIGSDRQDDGHAQLAVASMCLYFLGTVLYVKTLIRERGSRGWLLASRAFHALLLAACLSQEWWIAAGVAAALLLRAMVVPRLGWTPKRVGLTEIGFTAAVALTALLTLP